ncbi:MAG: DUF2339 domain-containing protein [Burkholderiales bacterium]|nr:DUF2339 domain-containing protein [Burkholderiales bacterium]
MPLLVPTDETQAQTQVQAEAEAPLTQGNAALKATPTNTTVIAIDQAIEPLLLLEPENDPANTAAAALKTAAPPEAKPAPAPVLPTSATATTTVKPPQTRTTATPPAAPTRSFRESLPAPLADFIFGGNALVKVGVLILFLGIAFLLRYAAERVTVPVEFRYVGVTLAGMGLLTLGWFLRHKRRDYALSLQGMAIGVFYLTTLSALKVHMLIAPEMGFAILLVVSILSAALAVLQQAPVLAIIAALEGFVSPVLTSTGANRPLGLFTYLAVLDVGIFLVAWFNAWRVLNLIAFVGTFTLSIGWAQKFYADSDYALVQPFLIFFFVLFAVIGVLFARRTLSEARHEASLANAQGSPIEGIKLVGRVDSALVFGNPVTAFGLQYILVQHSEMGAAFSAIAMAFFYLLLARLVFSKEKQGLALLAESYVIVAAIFGTLAIPLGLEGSWTSAAWALEGAGMYWLGQRQNRPYARVFSLLVLGGASVKLLFAISVNSLPDQPLFEGALLGPFLLGCSALAMWRLHLRSTMAQTSNSLLGQLEQAGSALLPWLGFAALNCLPWMLLVPPLASATCAVLALLLTEMCIRWQLSDLRPIAATIQVLAVISYLFGIHTNQDSGSGSFLQSDWHGMGAAIVIALSVLFNAGRYMLRHKRNAEANGLPPNWSAINQLAMLVGFGLLHLAMLFAIDLSQAAALWPFTAALVLSLALWMSHGTLAAFALGLQVLSAALYLLKSPVITTGTFMHLGFVTPLALAVTGLWSADRIQHEAKRHVHYSALPHTELPRPWLNSWCCLDSALWFAPVWALAWWFTAWISESDFALENAHLSAARPTVTVLIAIASSAILLSLAHWRRWLQAGVLSALSLPFYVVCMLMGIEHLNTTGISTSPYLPSAAWGWLAWPLALTWFYFSLKRQEIFFATYQRLYKLLHVAGLWFFVLLVSMELRAQVLIHLGDAATPDSSWLHLAWIIAPALCLYGLSRPALEKIWPLTSYRFSYLETAGAPVALYLLLWSWVSNLNGAGNAQPLPYLPLLNPLEIAHLIVLLSLFLWWRALPENSPVKLPPATSMTLIAATTFALLTAGVLRAVHHYADIPWQATSLFDSRLAQAAVSITWALTGVSLMLTGNRRASRTTWIAGAALLGVVVAKLFLIELADRGGLYRIISFMGVGIAFLVVGYFAPVPVKKAEAQV